MWRRQAFTWRFAVFSAEGSQQALPGYFVGGQAVGSLRQVFLYVLITLGQLFYQAGGGVEVGHHFALIAVETLLQIVQLALGAVRCGMGQQAGGQEADGNTNQQGKGRQQPGGERLFHESFL